MAESLTQTKIIRELNSRELSLFNITDFKKIFSIKKDNNVYKIIERLTNKGILQRLAKKKYLFSLLSYSDFEISNFLYSPSYVSLESALSLYEIIDQFPYQITSVTLKKTKRIRALNKEFTYSHIKKELFFGYEKKDKFLIALPEKAFFDYLYFTSKGLRSFDKKDFNLKKLNKKLLLSFIKKAKNKQFKKFLAEAKI